MTIIRVDSNTEYEFTGWRPTVVGADPPRKIHSSNGCSASDILCWIRPFFTVENVAGIRQNRHWTAPDTSSKLSNYSVNFYLEANAAAIPLSYPFRTATILVQFYSQIVKYAAISWITFDFFPGVVLFPTKCQISTELFLSIWIYRHILKSLVQSSRRAHQMNTFGESNFNDTLRGSVSKETLKVKNMKCIWLKYKRNHHCHRNKSKNQVVF